MNNDLAKKISEALKLQEVMEFYGIYFNDRGFAKCPFHNEKTASLTIKREHYKCFGCGAYGGVIDFVMEYFGLKFIPALVKLDNDFSLGLITNKKPNLDEQKQLSENRRIERAYKKYKENIHQEYLTVCELHSILYRRVCNGEEWLQEIVEWLDYLLDDFSGEGARLWKAIFQK